MGAMACVHSIESRSVQSNYILSWDSIFDIIVSVMVMQK